MRPSGRAPDEMRAIEIQTGFTKHAEGSVLVSFGDTRVLVTASVEEKVPPFLRGKAQGWVTAEYSMLPRATHTRGSREAAKGKQSGRTQEIQRLIGRSLRAVVDMKKLGERQIIIDCDVIQADGGTRTVTCPADGSTVGVVSEATAADTEKAIAAARRAFDEGSWSATPAARRGDLLLKVADALVERKDEFARAVAGRVGARSRPPCRAAEAGDVR